MEFNRWLQNRINVHTGSRLTLDGDWGRTSIAALRSFQRKTGLDETGVADDATVQALRLAPGNPAQIVSSHPESMSPWMSEMYRRMGLHEVRNNSEIIDWLRSAGRFLGNPRDLPWCGDAVETCIAKTLPEEPLPTNPFFAQNWAKFGRNLGSPQIGSIGVIKWSDTSGHVGIVAGIDGNAVILLGGNQSNAITLAPFSRKKFIAYRWPSTYQLKSYPPIKGTTVLASGEQDTR